MTPIEMRLFAVLGLVVIGALALTLAWAIDAAIRAARNVPARMRHDGVAVLGTVLSARAARPLERRDAVGRQRC